MTGLQNTVMVSQVLMYRLFDTFPFWSLFPFSYLIMYVLPGWCTSLTVYSPEVIRPRKDLEFLTPVLINGLFFEPA
jgi:hypothetical protein